jgi:membrane protease YdiL (CAAX protease family)
MHRPHCGKHPQMPAVARCTACGRYICRDCIREISARPYCAECREEAAKRQEALDREASRPEQPPAQEGPPPASQPPPPPPPPPQQVYQPVSGGPVGARLVTTCSFHPGVRAITRCSTCGAFICSGCMRIVGSKRVCEVCLNRDYTVGYGDTYGRPPVAWKLPQARKEPSLASAPWELWPGLLFLPIPFLLNGIMSYMMRQGEELSVGAAQILLSLLLYSTTLFFAFVIVSRYGPALEEIGFTRKNLPSSLGLGFVGGALSFGLALVSIFLSMGLFERFDYVERWLRGFFELNFKDITGIDVLIAGVIIVIVAPICEEIFFRGYLYPPMRRKLGVGWAALLNGFLFSLVHFSLFGLIGRTLAGALFCLLYEYNDNLAAPITAHFINNFIAFFLPIVAIWSM